MIPRQIYNNNDIVIYEFDLPRSDAYIFNPGITSSTQSSSYITYGVGSIEVKNPLGVVVNTRTAGESIDSSQWGVSQVEPLAVYATTDLAVFYCISKIDGLYVNRAEHRNSFGEQITIQSYSKLFVTMGSVLFNGVVYGPSSVIDVKVGDMLNVLEDNTFASEIG